MNTLHQFSFLYPNAVAVAGILIAIAVVYFAGKVLAWVFSSTEKKIEHEPSIMTELDELRRDNERLSTMYDQLAYDHDVLGHECDVLSHEFDTYKKYAQEVHDRITKLYEAELAAKKDLSTKLWYSRREVAKLKRDLISATAQIAELGSKYTSCERERSEYESMYNSILAQYAELKVKIKTIEKVKPAREPNSETDLPELNDEEPTPIYQ